MEVIKATTERMSLLFGERFFVFLTFDEMLYWSFSGKVKVGADTLRAYTYPDVAFKVLESLNINKKFYIIGTTKENLFSMGFHEPRDVDIRNSEVEYLDFDKQNTEVDFSCTDMYCQMKEPDEVIAFRKRAKEDCDKRKQIHTRDECETD